MSESLPATLEIQLFRPVGNFNFHFSKNDHTKADGTRCLYAGGCNIIHIPFRLPDSTMKELYSLMKANNSDVLFDGMHCYTTGNNSLMMVSHPELTAWVKAHY